MKKPIIGLLALAASATLSAGNYSNEVLSIGVGARALGMGGAYTGVADDSTAVYWNPAALPKVKHMEVAAVQQGRSGAAINFNTNEVGSQYFFMSGGMNLGKDVGTIGAAVMRFGVDGIPQISGVDPVTGEPQKVGEFKTEDYGVLASFGRSLHKSIGLGASLKYLGGGTSGLKAQGAVTGDAKYTYFGADLALLAEFGGMTPALEGLSLGLNVQDVLNSGVKWSNTPTSPTDAVDINPKVGLAYSLPLDFLKKSQSSFTLAFDADPKYAFNGGNNALLHYGAEFWYKDTLAFRGGLRQFLGGLQSPEMSLGASFRLYILQVDYSYINYELTPIHYLSLAVRF